MNFLQKEFINENLKKTNKASKIEFQKKLYYKITKKTKLHEKKNFHQKSQKKHEIKTLNKIITKKYLTLYQKSNVSIETTFHIKKMIQKILKILKKTKRKFLNFHFESSSISTFFRT